MTAEALAFAGDRLGLFNNIRLVPAATPLPGSMVKLSGSLSL